MVLIHPIELGAMVFAGRIVSGEEKDDGAQTTTDIQSDSQGDCLGQLDSQA